MVDGIFIIVKMKDEIIPKIKICVIMLKKVLEKFLNDRMNIIDAKKVNETLAIYKSIWNA